jgi:Ca2+-transporting ATPase
LIIYVPGLRNLFRFAPLHPIDIAICLSAGLISVTWFEVFKIVSRRRTKSSPPRAPLASASA